MEIDVAKQGNANKKIDLMWKYVLFSYFLFWMMVMVLGGSAAMVFNAPPLIQRIVQAFCAWAPTFAFLFMFKKLIPATTLKDFIISVFKQKIRLDLMIVSGFAVILSSMLPLWVLSISGGKPFVSYFSLHGYTLLTSFFLSLFAGPLGEELGWRGYLRVELDKKFGFIKASLLGGAIWAFWHAILWFVNVAFEGGATGWPLLIYIISNVVVMTSLVIIMNVVMKRSNNLLNAIWIHLVFNLIYVHLNDVDTLFFALIALSYSITGVFFLLYHYGYLSRPKQAQDLP